MVTFSLGFHGFFVVLLGFTEFYWVLLGFTEFYLVLLGFTGFYWVLLGFTGFYWVLLGFTRFYLVLLGFTEFYWNLLLSFYWLLFYRCLFDYEMKFNVSCCGSIRNEWSCGVLNFELWRGFAFALPWNSIPSINQVVLVAIDWLKTPNRSSSIRHHRIRWGIPTSADAIIAPRRIDKSGVVDDAGGDGSIPAEEQRRR